MVSELMKDIYRGCSNDSNGLMKVAVLMLEAVALAFPFANTSLKPTDKQYM